MSVPFACPTMTFADSVDVALDTLISTIGYTHANCAKIAKIGAR